MSTSESLPRATCRARLWSIRSRAAEDFVRQVDHPDIEAGRRADMGDPAAHLTGPDHPDAQHLRLLSRIRGGAGRPGPWFRRQPLSSAALNSGIALNRSATRP